MSSSDEVLAGIFAARGVIEEDENLSGNKEQSHEFTVYLRPDFVTDGLDAVQKCYSKEAMVLKDVIVQFLKGTIGMY